MENKQTRFSEVIDAKIKLWRAQGCRTVPVLNLLIKPVSAACNLRCNYCFYLAENACQQSLNLDRIMPQETRQLLILEGLLNSKYQCNFIFQGGEPTLAGIRWYEAFLQDLKELKVYLQNSGLKILLPSCTFSLQTNGYQLQKKWFELWQKENFLIGLSIDGSADLHDKYRKTAADLKHKVKGATHVSVIDSLKQLQAAKIEYSVLCVVTENLAQTGSAAYRYLRSLDVNSLQFIPCLSPLAESKAAIKQNPLYNFLQDCAPSAESYSYFLDEVFQAWSQERLGGKNIYLRLFDNWIDILLGRNPEACDMQGTCSCQYVIESNGSVFPCDFYVYPKWQLGNLQTDNLLALNAQATCKAFCERSYPLFSACRTCPWLPLCRNGCYRWRKHDKFIYCAAYKDFFNKHAKTLNQLVQIKKQTL